MPPGSCAIPCDGAIEARAPDGWDMDGQLVVRAQGGDEAAFETLTEALLDRFHAVARNILRDPTLAEDAIQAALVRVWRDLPRLRDAERFEAWAYRLLVNACYSEARRARRWIPSLLRDPMAGPVVADGTSAVADRDQLERGFRRLRVEQRAVVVLHHYLDLPLAEVAAVLGIPEGTVRSRLHRAMEGLRAALAADARAPQRIAMSKEVER